MQEFTLIDKRAERIVTVLRQLVVHRSLDIEQIAMELSISIRMTRNDVGLWLRRSRARSTKGRH